MNRNPQDTGMDIDTLQILREHVTAQRTSNALLIIDAAIEDLKAMEEDEDEDEDEDDDEALSEDGHPCCECGRPEHLCQTFNDPDADHGDA
jgi:hypothetical protein